MKTNEEMSEAVFRRIGEYEQRHRILRRRMQIIGSTAACFAILLAGIAVWHGRADKPQPLTVTVEGQSEAEGASGIDEAPTEAVPETGVPQSGIPETFPGETMPAVTGQNGTAPAFTTLTEIAPEHSADSTETAVSGGNAPGAVQTIPAYDTTAKVTGTVTGVTSGLKTTPTQTQTTADSGSLMNVCVPYYDCIYHERAAGALPADAHRPAGYAENIGSALALNMSIREPAYAEYLERVKGDTPTPYSDLKPFYPVVIWQAGTAEIGEPRELIGQGYVCSFSLGGMTYHSAVIAAEDIERCAAAGWHVSYVGRGTTPETDRSWETANGILANCELYGDGFTGWSSENMRDPERIQLFTVGEPE